MEELNEMYLPTRQQIHAPTALAQTSGRARSTAVGAMRPDTLTKLGMPYRFSGQ
jgi:hypothetical protein